MKKENASAFNSWRAFTNSEDSVGRIAQLKKKKEEKILACESSVSCDTSSITFPRFLNYTYDAFLSSSFFSLDSLFRFSLPVFHPLFVASVFAAPNPVSLTGGNSVPGSYKVIFMIVVYNFYFEQKSFDWMEGEKNVIKFARENWITTDHAVYLDPNWFPSTEMKSKRLETNQLSFFFFLLLLSSLFLLLLFCKWKLPNSTVIRPSSNNSGKDNFGGNAFLLLSRDGMWTRSSNNDKRKRLQWENVTGNCQVAATRAYCFIRN